MFFCSFLFIIANFCLRIFAGTDAEWNQIIKSASNDEEEEEEEEEEVPTLIADVSTILDDDFSPQADEGMLSLCSRNLYLLLDALLLSASNEASFIEEEEAPTLNTDAPLSWEPVAGMRVEIYWKGIKKWERGTVLRELSKMPGHYRIKYGVVIHHVCSSLTNGVV
jgi:hypothetical protein